MKYKVKEYQGIFKIRADDTYIFPAEKYLQSECIVETDKDITPDEAAAKAMYNKYSGPNESLQDYELQLEAFKYYYDDQDDIHYFNYDIDNGDEVEFITLCVVEVE